MSNNSLRSSILCLFTSRYFWTWIISHGTQCLTFITSKSSRLNYQGYMGFNHSMISWKHLVKFSPSWASSNSLPSRGCKSKLGQSVSANSQASCHMMITMMIMMIAPLFDFFNFLTPPPKKNICWSPRLILISHLDFCLKCRCLVGLSRGFVRWRSHAD